MLWLHKVPWRVVFAVLTLLALAAAAGAPSGYSTG